MPETVCRDDRRLAAREVVNWEEVGAAECVDGGEGPPETMESNSKQWHGLSFFRGSSGERLHESEGTAVGPVG